MTRASSWRGGLAAVLAAASLLAHAADPAKVLRYAFQFAESTFDPVAYQDATSHELLLATRKSDGTWQRESIAGNTDPWPGAYGFFASAVLADGNVVMSTWVINQPEDDNWVEVFSKPFVIQ